MQDVKMLVSWAGREQAVKIQQGDITNWEIQRAVNNWPQQDDAWNLWATFVAFNALRRLGHIDQGTPFTVFVDQVEAIRLEGTDEVDPTPPAPTAD